MMVAEDAALHRAQRSFRAVLDAFARPGEVRSIEVDDGGAARPVAMEPALWSLASLFVDQATTACVVDAEADEAMRFMTAQTHVRARSLDKAAFVVVPTRADESFERRAVAEARCGTLASPELGATVLVGCARVADEAEAALYGLRVFEVSGPGVADVNRFAVSRRVWAEARAARGDEFPCGIDVVLVDERGRVVAIPRTSAVVLVEEAR